MSQTLPPPVPDLDELERRFRDAFAGRDDGSLEVIGYGEISSVVRWEGAIGPVAAKRLPNFATAQHRRAHIDLMAEYIELLAGLGVEVLPTRFEELDNEDGSFVAYAVQALVGPQHLAVAALLAATPVEGERILRSVIESTAAVVGDERYGLDAQLSNWVVMGDGLSYLDITTPFIRDLGTGISRLDTRIFVASLPWLLRWPVQRFVAGDIVAGYFDLRTTLVDAIANLHKEHAGDWIPTAVDLANRHVDEPITIEQVDRYYNKDQRLWSLLQRLRRLDRWWQHNVRRRPYPVLLPGRIDR